MNQRTIATMSRSGVRDLAEQAFLSEGGLTIEFTVARYGDLAVCKNLARAIQTAFSSIRSAARDKQQRLCTNMAERLNTKGPYDDLMCSTAPLPFGQGYTVTIIRADIWLCDLDVRSATTGEPILAFTEKGRRLTEMATRWFEACKVNPFVNPWSREDEVWIEANFPGYIADYYGPRGISLRADDERAPSAPTSNDPTAIPLDIDPFGD